MHKYMTKLYIWLTHGMPIIILPPTPLAKAIAVLIIPSNLVIEDLNSNALSNEQETFTFFIPQAKDIIINELFPEQDIAQGQTAVLNTLDLTYYPDTRGPYNFQTNGDIITL